MERIGIIGVGGLARALVPGLCDEVAEPPEVHLSPRGAETAAELAGRYPTVQVCRDNQDVVDRSDTVLLAVRAEHLAEAVAGLDIPGDRVVVNLMAGVSVEDLAKVLPTEAPQVRAMPLQAVRERGSLTVTFPAHPVVDGLFDRLGGALPVADERAFNAFVALTATMSTHVAYLAALNDWAQRQGVPAGDGERFLRNLFEGVGRALGDGTRSLEQLLEAHETAGGFNERLRLTWFEGANAEALQHRLDELLADLS